MQFLLSFLRDPSAIRTDCLNDLLPIEYNVSAAVAEQVLGVDDAYDGVLPTVSPSPPPAVASAGVSVGTFCGVVAHLAVLAFGLVAWIVLRERQRSHNVARDGEMRRSLL